MAQLGDTLYILLRVRSQLGRMINHVAMHKAISENCLEEAKGPIYHMPELDYWQLMIDTILRLQARGYIN